VFFLNTLVIVVGQVGVLRRIEGRSRTRSSPSRHCSGARSGWWSRSRPASPRGWRAWLIALGFSVFALGEMIFSPVGPVPDQLVRAPAPCAGATTRFGGLTWGVSGAIGPALAGVGIGGGWGVLWALGLAVGCGVASVILYSLRHLADPRGGRAHGYVRTTRAEVGG